MNESWMKICTEREKWKIKYIDLENYMNGNVFHYTSGVALENIIKNKTLWITKSDFLNDKTEYMYALNLVKKVFEKNDYKHLSISLSQINKEIKSDLSRSFIFSTSQNNDSINLWGNYTKCEGYNIGFNLNKIFDIQWSGKIYVTGNKRNRDGTLRKHFLTRKDQYKSVIMSPGKVIYDMKIQESIISDIFDFLDRTFNSYYFYLNEINDMDQRGFEMLKHHFNLSIGTALRILSSQIQLFKNPVFAQDEEYRIIFDVKSRLDVIKYRQFNGVFIPYIEVVFDNNTDKTGMPINSITIGPKNNLDIAEKGLKLFLISQEYKVTANAEIKDKLLIKKSAVPFRY